jgi:hypothetical protein
MVRPRWHRYSGQQALRPDAERPERPVGGADRPYPETGAWSRLGHGWRVA